MARLLLEDVTLTKRKDITIRVRFKGGATDVVTLPLPRRVYELRKLSPAVIQEIDLLLDRHTTDEIATTLNERGLHAGAGGPFDAVGIQHALRCYGLKSRQQRLRETGLLTSAEMAAMLHTTPTMIWYWRCRGVLNGEAYGKNKFLYHPPGLELLNRH